MSFFDLNKIASEYDEIYHQYKKSVRKHNTNSLGFRAFVIIMFVLVYSIILKNFSEDFLFFFSVLYLVLVTPFLAIILNKITNYFFDLKEEDTKKFQDYSDYYFNYAVLNKDLTALRIFNFYSEIQTDYIKKKLKEIKSLEDPKEKMQIESDIRILKDKFEK